MNSLSFGQFLVERRLITDQEHKLALNIQNKSRLLGEIAIEMNCLSRDDLPLILEYMEKRDNVQFGEAAVSLGLLNVSQLRYLLGIRTRRKVKIGDILLKEGFISEQDLLGAVMEFDRKRRRLHKVLIADKDEAVSQSLESSLGKYGYEVATARNGNEALALAARNKPDILMAAGLLPDMDGIELCKRMTSNPDTFGVNMVLLSTVDKQEYVDQAFETGVSHYLKTPVNESELINVIYQIERDASGKRSEKILVVDDSKGARVIISRELESGGFQVQIAEDGKMAVEKAKSMKPDIITMDLEMPVMNGFEACSRLKNDPETADIPVIIISGQTSQKIKNRGFDAGAVEFFEKPFKTGRLAEYVSMLLETRKIRRRENIMIVEDANTTRHIFKYIFEKNGYNVYTASDAEQALVLLPKCDPDLIVTDCYMPGKSGFELTGEIKRMKQYRHIPVLMVTASDKREDILQGLAAGANDYILKPFDEAELIARASTHLVNKHLYEEAVLEKEALKDSEEKFRVLFNNQSDAVFVHKISGDSAGNRFLEVNDLACDRLGYTREELLTMSPADIDDKDAPPPPPEEMAGIMDTIKSGETATLKRCHVAKDGRKIPVEINSRLVTFEGGPVILSMARDITERQLAEEKVENSFQSQKILNELLKISLQKTPLEEQLKQALETILSTPWLETQPKGAILLANHDEQVLELKASKNLPESLAKLCGQVPFGECLCGKAVEQGGIVFRDHVDEDHQYTYPGMADHGHYVAPLIYEESVIGVLCLYLDAGHKSTTEEIDFLNAVANALTALINEKRAEELLIEAKEKAEEATKLKDKFVSLVAHDLRSPFTSILGLMNVFQVDKELNFSEQHRTVIDSIINGGERMVNMIDELLDINKLQSGRISTHMRFIDGYITAERVCDDMMAHAAQKGIELVNEIPAGARLYTDFNLFSEVLRNLISNAIKFSHKDGRVTVFAPEDRPGVIAVQDTGVGVDPNMIPALFRYEIKTTSIGTSGEKGSGLGLALSSEIMESLNGELNVESIEGEGSVFYAITPPVRPCVLIAEDNLPEREMMKKRIESLGADVITVENGIQALESIDRNTVHLIITDIMMPEMNGLELIKSVKRNQKTSSLPIIAVTGASQDDTRIKAISLGADDFIAKPVNMAELEPRVRKFIG